MSSIITVLDLLDVHNELCGKYTDSVKAGDVEKAHMYAEQDENLVTYIQTNFAAEIATITAVMSLPY